MQIVSMRRKSVVESPVRTVVIKYDAYAIPYFVFRDNKLYSFSALQKIIIRI